MTDLAKLVVSLEAQTTKYQRGLDQANKKLDRFSKQQDKQLSRVNTAFGKAAGAVKSFIGVYAGLAGLRALTSLTSDTINALDKIDKLNLSLGVTEGLLSRLEFAAGQAGTNLDVVAKAIARSQDVLVDARTGLLEAERAFDNLGLSVDKLLQLSPDQQFLAISKALSEIQNQALRINIARDVFGRAGVEILPLLENFDKLLAKLREAEELGFVVSKEDADAAAAAKDAIDKLSTSFAGLGRTLVVEVSPGLTAVADKLTEISKDRGGLLKFFAQIAALPFAPGLAIGPLLQPPGEPPGVVAGSGTIVRDARGENKLPSVLSSQTLDATQKRVSDLMEQETAVLEDIRTRRLDLENLIVEEDRRRIDQQTNLELAAIEQTSEAALKAKQDLAEKQKAFDAKVKDQQQAFGEIFRDNLIVSSQSGFDGVLQLWIDTLQQMLIRAAGAKLFEALFPTGVGLEGSTGFGGLITKVGSIFGFAEGGVVPGPMGRPQLALVHGGETVTPPGQVAGGFTQNIYVPLTFPPQLDAHVRNVAGQAGANAAMKLLNAQNGRI